MNYSYDALDRMTRVTQSGSNASDKRVDLTYDAADALIERQVRSGLVVRMAVLYDLLTHGPVEVKVAEIEEVA